MQSKHNLVIFPDEIWLIQKVVKIFTFLLSPVTEVSMPLIVQEQILASDLEIRWVWNVSARKGGIKYLEINLTKRGKKICPQKTIRH